MSNKSLSTGTLSLRFMQNALRKQHLQEVELERAEVTDEGKWEVGQDIKEAWGIERGTRTNDPVAYETSYLPFLFSREDEDAASSSVSKPLGRRVFNKNGQDVSTSQSQIQAQVEPDGDGPADEIQREAEVDGDTSLSSSIQTSKTNDLLTKGRKFKVHAKPVSISSAVGKGLKGFNTWDQSAKTTQKSPTKTKQKSAREAIFGSMSGVGSDLRPTKYTTTGGMGKLSKTKIDDEPEQMQKRQQPQPQPQVAPVSKGFLKPAGVDEPAPRKAVLSTSPGEASGEPVSPDIIDGARKKRPRDQSDGGGTDKKKNKKKRSKLNKEPAGSQ